MRSDSDASVSITSSARGATLAVTVSPRASKSGIERLTDGSIRVRLAAPPVDGAANTALLRYLADELGLPRSRLSIASGATSRRKRIAFDGMSLDELNARMQDALACQP